LADLPSESSFSRGSLA